MGGTARSFHGLDPAGPHLVVQNGEWGSLASIKPCDRRRLRPVPRKLAPQKGGTMTWLKSSPMGGREHGLPLNQLHRGKGFGLAPQEEGGIAQPQPALVERKGHGLAPQREGDTANPYPSSAEGRGHGLVPIWLCRGRVVAQLSPRVGIFTTQRGGSTSAAPLMPNFPSHREPHGPDSKALQAAFSPQARG